ncbi:MAG TPA: hypothetical protein VEW42_03230 [Candidatus Eisenbacteria bacterium]|nr:hypothetical protein [Candidatus Eisenbacteria bacterium]
MARQAILTRQGAANVRNPEVLEALRSIGIVAHPQERGINFLRYGEDVDLNPVLDGAKTVMPGGRGTGRYRRAIEIANNNAK